MKQCLQCDKELVKWQKKFCSLSCSTTYNNIGINRHGTIKKVHCLQCNKETINSKFCSKSCSVTYNNSGINRHGTGKKYCLSCNKEIPNRNKYCNSSCQKEYQRSLYITRWFSGEEDGTSSSGCSHYIKSYLMDKYDSKCQICDWGITNKTSGRVPLEVHHVDGDWENNRPNNLMLICPNCH